MFSKRTIRITLLILCLLLIAGLIVFNSSDFFSDASPPVREVVLTEKGYVPREFTVPKGSVVRFKSTIGRQHWPSSDLHPSHDIYPSFDPLRPLEPDEVWEMTFDKVGTWGLHDHIRSYYTGVVHVE